MPPRIPTSSKSSQALLHNLSDVIISSSSPSPAHYHHNGLITAAVAATANLNFTPGTFRHAQRHQSTPSTTRQFSTTQPLGKLTRLRKSFFQWLRTSGRAHRDATKPYNYVRGVVNTAEVEGDNDRPFPLNPAFRSQPVLDEAARETIWRNVMEDGLPLKVVSARYSVDMRRVAAVLRMKAIEKQWESEVGRFFFLFRPFFFPFPRLSLLLPPSPFSVLEHGEGGNTSVQNDEYNKNSISLEDITYG